ncbi:MAG TPA: N-acetyl-1-D-myo-inositol-2-amino-2-deoxy-alpha-D-glucopyranoside deacetylase [Streptosporangiaceae bacterium]|nr:N-acetyl-1-D-myo-inositol-2-amino-2-deoxy-alpha-D-glucopyranoside deacetylase [Streptosporangiaceae bacterium]
MSGPDRGQRMLLVHAHPDDESIGTGATMAKYAAEGAGVTLITCTLGELGEVIPPDLAHLAADAEGGLGDYRIGELEAACAALGVTDHRFLGGAGRWHDSGMMGLPANDAPGSFWRADVDEAAGDLLAVIREVRPQVMVSYDDNGFYGHPDHIQAHRVAKRAFDLAEGLVTKFYATALPRSALTQAIDSLRNSQQEGGFPGGAPDFTEVESADDFPFGVSDEQVTTAIDATAYLDQKIAAMRAHATQIAVESPFFALSDRVGQRAFGREYYTLLSGPRGPGSGPHDWETDLFAGIG